jgi:mannose-6-phosphate isomerase
VDPLRGAVRRYSWGSHTAIAELTRRPWPTSHPEAELWLGAHTDDPAAVISDVGERSLLELLRANPERLLGRTVHSRFGPELPYLMKVIAAAEPLSLQAHPNSAQAHDGFAKEERAGLAPNASSRNYRDTRHKPEIVIALEPFEALAGFRHLPRTRKLLRAIDFTEYDCVLDSAEPAAALKTLLTAWLTSPKEVIGRDVDVVVAGASAYLKSGRREFATECTTLVELGERYPGDPGVLAATLLNRISLQAGEALFLPAGNLHAYLRGMAIEVMANSDNVLRGGLTTKHVDVAELLRVLDFTPIDAVDLRPDIHEDGPRRVYRPPVDEFEVTKWTLNNGRIGQEVIALESERGPHIFLCIDGSGNMMDAKSSLHLERGDAAWVSHCDRPIRLIADRPCTLFSVGVPAA